MFRHLRTRHFSESHSPGYLNREWIETSGSLAGSFTSSNSPGYLNREWIETAPSTHHTSVMRQFSRLFKSGVD